MDLGNWAASGAADNTVQIQKPDSSRKLRRQETSMSVPWVETNNMAAAVDVNDDIGLRDK